MASASNRQPPPAIQFEAQPFGLAFHPSQNVVAAGLIDGHVHCYRYASDGNQTLFSIRPHKKSCRAVEFNHDGTVLFTASKDKSLQAVDAATGNVMIKKAGAHSAPINAMTRLNEAVLMTGDDDGTIKGWDIRTGEEVIEYSENEDYISDITYHEPNKTVLATSADGCLSVFDIRKSKPLAMSENQDDELLSVAVMKNGKKVVVGTQEGALHIFNWGAWGDCTDRFVGHPNSIDSIVKVNEDTIITGSSDGMIRVCGIHPNNLLGVIGEHEEFPIEHLRLSHDEVFLASCSHDDTVRFWDLHAAFGDDNDGEEEDGQPDQTADTTMDVDMEGGNGEASSGAADMRSKERRKGKKGKKPATVGSGSFFADL